MRLYAIVASERATKGQGGNKELSVELRHGSAKDSIVFLTIEAKSDNRGTAYTIKDGLKGGKVVYAGYIPPEEKAKRQKGECNDCTKGVTSYPETEEGTCSWCGRTK